MERLRHLTRRWGRTLRQIAGMPDYHGYLAHMAERHPGCAVLAEREYFTQYVESRYGGGASRCC
jgi:uncharacterized short protein YbdD (DUF466 family)